MWGGGGDWGACAVDAHAHATLSWGACVVLAQVWDAQLRATLAWFQFSTGSQASWQRLAAGGQQAYKSLSAPTLHSAPHLLRCAFA